MSDSQDSHPNGLLPHWVPTAVASYVAHTGAGRPIRALARDAGCHASTILRQVRRTEQRRDDPLVDLALARLGTGHILKPGNAPLTEINTMTATLDETIIDDATLEREALRVLRRMNEGGACLAMARDMEKAVVVRDIPDGRTLRTATVERPVAEALALKDWIQANGKGRIVRYRITQPGRLALKRLVAEDEAHRAAEVESGDAYANQHRTMRDRDIGDAGKRQRVRYNMSESPLLLLSRRKDKAGKSFLSPELVAAGERLREDFELAQMGPSVTQNWDKFLTAGSHGSAPGSSLPGGSEGARRRVSDALSELGPGLGDVVLRCCCFLEGMEAVEEHMGWSARSGKIVLRIALTRLKLHYDTCTEGWSPMIG